jgi:hypothetical protein
MIQLISNALMISLFVYLGLFATHIIIRNQKIESGLKYYFYGIATYFIFFIISQSMFLVNDIFIEEATLTYEVLYILGNFLGHIGLLVLMFVVEKQVYNNLKYIPTIIILISAILELIFFEYMIIFIVILLLTATVIPMIYIGVAIQTTGTTRTKGLFHGIGLIFFMLGILFNTYFMLNILKAFYIIGPIMQFLGVAIFHYALLFYEKKTIGG